MAAVTVSKKGWVVIPKELRERYGIRPGDKLHVIDVGGRLAIVRPHRDPIGYGYGLLRGGTSLALELVEEHRSEVEQDVRRPPDR